MEPDTEFAGPSSPGSAVLDANVLYPNALRDTLLRAAERGLFVPLWSTLILDEVRRNLVKDGREPHQVRRTLALMRHHFPQAEQIVSEALISRMTNAVEDRHVLAVAVAADAEMIVTSNLRDFPRHSVRPYRIVVLSPDDFLCHLLNARPKEMSRLIQEQSADLVRPRLTVEEVLARLAKQAPTFAVRARAVLE